MWRSGRREAIWAELDRPWDLVVVGGGITGAGILLEATRQGLRTLLVEQRDFAWGTSSRSSKLVHGGLRYLKEGKIGLTRASVLERERLLREHAGLVHPVNFLLPTRRGKHASRWMYALGLGLYDLLAGRLTHRRLGVEEIRSDFPSLATEALDGGFQYRDAEVDDARLVLRVLQEAIAGGGAALNYTQAESLLREGGEVVGLQLRDRESGRTMEVRAALVVSATGAWADALRRQLDAPPRIRPLRGSHLLFSRDRLPVPDAITFPHPRDGRPVFLVPWEGATLVGTTDLDHDHPLDEEPRITRGEVEYLMEALRSWFPTLGLGPEDVRSTWSGVRPVVDTGQADPSRESRDHVVWQESGLLTVTGGKLTTFRLIARDALRRARSRLPASRPAPSPSTPAPLEGNLPSALRTRLLGRYGALAGAVVAAARPGELEPVEDTPTPWAELRWGARAEGVLHLDDLMLRRTRLGLLLPEGAREILPRVGEICREELGWDAQRWEEEEAAYQRQWRESYSLPVEVRP